MNKFIITIVFTFLLFGNAFGIVSWEYVQESIRILKKNLTETTDNLVADPANEETLKKLGEILPTGPKGVWSGVEKDVFFPKIDRNKAAIEFLEKKIKLFSEAIKELNQFLESQKSIQKKWNIFPKGVWSEVDKDILDIFFPKIDKNKAAIEILEKKIKLFSKAIEELSKFLESQKSIQKKWNTFFETRRES